MQLFEGGDVLGLTQSVAGPICTQLLATLEANVVKVEPPDGNAFRRVLDGGDIRRVQPRPQTESRLHLKTEEGADIVRELAERADVVIKSFRPGVLGQFDLNYESVKERNEEVVYCSITDFG